MKSNNDKMFLFERVFASISIGVILNLCMLFWNYYIFGIISILLNLYIFIKSSNKIKSLKNNYNCIKGFVINKFFIIFLFMIAIFFNHYKPLNIEYKDISLMFIILYQALTTILYIINFITFRYKYDKLDSPGL
ncbi:MAG: hypothetical protein COB73_09515 [Flavobacteriaceae bacterium]|nr:MAG: hypothetical protein COB73_09515 [Flavobacteriaceae bacterium]